MREYVAKEMRTGRGSQALTAYDPLVVNRYKVGGVRVVISVNVTPVATPEGLPPQLAHEYVVADLMGLLKNL
jgi:hypothetical protein